MNIRRVALLGAIFWLPSLSLVPHATAQSSQPETVDQAMVKIVKAFRARTGKRDMPRRASFSVNDWPAGTAQFVKVERDSTPILGDPRLTAPTLTIVAIAKSGEIFTFVAQNQIVELINPLGSGVNGTGIWYKVRLLDGTQGWLFSNAENRSRPFASLIRTSMPATGTETGTSSLLIFVMLVAAVFIFLRKPGSHSPSPASEESSSWNVGQSHESPTPSRSDPGKSKSPSMIEDLYSFFEGSRERAARLGQHFEAGAEEARQAKFVGRAIHGVDHLIATTLPSTKEHQAREAGYHHDQETDKHGDGS